MTCRIICQARLKKSQPELAGFQQGSLPTIPLCDFCPEDVKNKARAWKGSENDSEDDTWTKNSLVRADSTQTDTRAKKQQNFIIVSHSFAHPIRPMCHHLSRMVFQSWILKSRSSSMTSGASVPTRQKLSTTTKLVRSMQK
jgi:hypothetical protein